MKKTKMLKKNYDFRRVLSNGKFYRGTYIQISILKSKNQYNLLGLAVSTKAGNAVKRNRIKRFLRENYKNLEDKIMVGYEMVILLNKKTNIDDLNYKIIKQDFDNIINKSGILIR